MNEHVFQRKSAVSYDLSQKLYLSNRAYFSEDNNRIIGFNPDFPGNPIVISEKLFRLLKGFDSGQLISDALTRIDLDFSEALGYIDYFYEQGFLRNKVNPKRYTADDRLDNHISNLSFWIHINNHCNLECSYCFVNKFKSTMTDEVIVSTTTAILKTVEARRVRNVNISYAGGEPTLSIDRIEKFSEQLHNKLSGSGVYLHEAIITNGTKLNERIFDFLKEKDRSVGVSLDGYGAEFHDRHRTFKGSHKGSWHIIEKNIERLISEGIKPYVMVVISAETVESLPKLVRWIGERDLTMRLSVVRQPEGNWHPADWPSAYGKLIAKLIPGFEAAFAEMELSGYSYEWSKRVRLCELHFDMPSYSTSCGIGSSHVVVQDDGKIASCPMTIRENPVAAEDDLIAATSKTMTISPRIRNEAEEKNCLDCQWFPVCVSGCPVTNERVKGIPFTISPMHDFYAYVIPRFVKFLGRKLTQAAADNMVVTYDLLDEAAIFENLSWRPEREGL